MGQQESGNGYGTVLRERRKNRRYSFRCSLQYRVTVSPTDEIRGLGETLDISSRGISFSTSSPLLVNRPIQISIDWPALLEGKLPLQLVAHGGIVRATATEAAIAIVTYQFKLRAPAAMRAGS